MGPDRLERARLVETLFAQAANLKATERARFLDVVCGADRGLRADLESLLSADAADDTFIHSAVTDIRRSAVGEPEPASEKSIPQRIGPYRLQERLGRGGMGEVYRAVRENEFHMQVALKLVRRGVDPELAVTHFQREREILARLDHPNIARILDGGTTTDGLPYFVMEYVEGRP